MNRSANSRILSAILALVMVISMIPFAVFAADDSATTATLVTDVANLAVGDQVVIVASGFDYALSTNQKSNNRGTAAITKDGNTVTLTEEVQILTLAAGTVDGTFAFSTGSGYLYAAGQSKAQNGNKNNNYLKTQTTLDANGSWTIVIADGVATIVAQGDNGCNVMQYNSSSTLFSAYSSASQAAVSIYKVAQSGSEPPIEPSDPTPSEPEIVEGTTYILTDTLAAGDKVILFNAGNSVAVSSTASGYKLKGEALTPVSDVITTNLDTVVWTVGINDDGTYTFTQGEMVLGMVQSGSYINLSTKASDGYTAWTLESSTTANVFYMKNTNMPEGSYGPYYLEWYDGGFTAYDSNSPKDAAFGISFYKEGTPPAEPDTPVEPDIPTGTTYVLTDTLAAGDKVILFNAGNSVAVSSTASGYKLKGEALTPVSDVITTNLDTVVWTVGINDDGTYTFTQGEMVLGMVQSGSYINLSTKASDGYTAWTLESSTTANVFYMKNTNMPEGSYGPYYLEWYDGGFTAYDSNSPKDAAFGISFYKEGTPPAEPDTPVEPEEPVEPEVPEIPEGTVATLVTSVNDLVVGGEYILVAPSKTAVMGPSAGNYYASVTEGFTLSEGNATAYFDEAKTQTLILGAGASAGTWSFNASGVYLAAVSGSNNHLKNETSVSAFSSWNIEIAADGVATIKSTGNTERNWIRYNVSSPRFSCYKSGQADIAIYKVEREPVRESGIITDLSTLQDGDKVVVFNPANNMALSTTYSGFYNNGTAVTMTDSKLSGYTDADVWTVGINTDGSYTFSTADGKKLSMGASYSSMPLDDVNTAWEISPAATADCFYIKNIARGNYIEWYAEKNNWSSYYNINNESLFAQMLYLITDEVQEDESTLPAEGDQVVIYNLSANGVLAAENDKESIENALAEIVDGKAVPANGGVVFTVEMNGDYYRFHNETYGYLCSNGTGNNAFYSQEATEDADWTLTEGKSGGYNLESRTAKFNGKYSQYLEYYADAYKTYSMYNVTDYDIYEFFFYEVAEGVNVTGGIVNNPGIDFGTLYDAYVGAPYTFSFTVDAVFGVDGELTVMVGETSLTANEDGTYTIPAELIAGESLTITVTGTDTKGVTISGTATVTVKDEPVIGDVTPAANAQTFEDKKPVISAVITNAGEDAVITMTVGGEEVEAVYADGILTYTPSEDMADGRTTITVTVKRADGKTAEKVWSFTVGQAQFQLYFGQLHSHTTYSDGSGSLESALDYIASLPESANVDFVAFTDHSNYFDASGAANPEGALYNMSLATADSQKLWAEYVGAMREFNAKQSDVIAVPGFEMTWSGGPGHINTFNTPGIVSRNNTTLNNKTADAGMKAYYALLSQPEGADSISQFNHPGSTFGTFTDFAYWDAVIDTRIQLVEVGNGEGQIGAGGYYPSYEYYTMALDKGWHVAPTNNQDNHKGKWGNANDARDVIITDDFSEEGIYAAIRAMRMYATEDKNLEIGYTVNGQMLGSTISEVPEELNIGVTVYDPDKSDSISKVEVIVNSGKVAYTWSDPADLADGALSVALKPDYSYYYIRVTEGDGDLAVTAPVWVGEMLKLGISAVETATSTPVTDEELTITTTLFNSESKEAVIKSMTYSIDGKVVETIDNPGTIPASGTAAVDYKFTPDSAKVQKLAVTAVVDLGGKEYTFSMDITLDVQDASKLVYIGIDASHYNEYVNGNYKDSMGNFSQLAAEYNVRTVTLYESADLIAACGNDKYVALILTAPSRRSGEAQAADPLKVYTAEELAAIKAFNENGGTVILAGWSDHYENYPDVASIKNMKPEEHMAATQNAVLEALGSSLRIGDDATYDDQYNGGQAYRLYFNSYNFDNFLVDGVEVDPAHPHDRMYTEVFSHYGGASVYTVDGKLPATVSPVVFGHSGTYSVDVDKDGLGGESMPKYTYAEGDERLMIMATEQLPGQGLIIVSGAAFMSNFEVQATIEDSGSEKNYSNYRVCENLLAYLNPVDVTDIAKVRAQTEVGYKYTIEGIVTSNASGYNKDTAFFDCIYVQDATGGICCFPVAGNYKIGDKVRITGTTEFYQGEPELQVSSIEVIGEGTIEPTAITASQLNGRSVEGLLVTISGTVESFELANGLVQTILVKDAEGNVARIFIDGYITTSQDVQNLVKGYNITATGLASYDNTFEGPFPRIRIRNRADIVCTEPKHNCEAEGHLWTEWETTVEPTCTEAGSKQRICTACRKVEVEAITATGHSHNAVVTAPTCTEQGYTTYTCACGDSYVSDYVDAHGHNVILKESNPATCELNGYEYYACEYCGGQEYTIILEATGHNYENGICTGCGQEDPNASKPGTGSWIGSLIGKWFDKWFGGNDDEPTVPPTEPEVPSEPSEPTEPEKPGKPGWGFIWDWIFWWN